jgi:Fe-S cluster assembly iron-binding protein IscA
MAGAADNASTDHTSRMLALTPEAGRAVLEFVVGQDPAPDAGLRISAGPPSAAERTWNYAVDHEPVAGDVVVEYGPARVFLAPDIAGELEHGVLDAHVDEQTLETRFIVRAGDAGGTL